MSRSRAKKPFFLELIGMKRLGEASFSGVVLVLASQGVGAGAAFGAALLHPRPLHPKSRLKTLSGGEFGWGGTSVKS